MSPQQTIEDEGWAFVDWIQANTRAVTIGAIIVAIGAGGFWFYLRSAQIKRLNAERGLNQAKQSLSAGNPALARTDLQRIATRYTGTPAGTQSALLLAQLAYDSAKYADGVKVLEPYQNSGAAGELLPSVWALTTDGQESAEGRGGDPVSRRAGFVPVPGSPGPDVRRQDGRCASDLAGPRQGPDRHRCPERGRDPARRAGRAAGRQELTDPDEVS